MFSVIQSMLNAPTAEHVDKEYAQQEEQEMTRVVGAATPLGPFTEMVLQNKRAKNGGRDGGASGSSHSQHASKQTKREFGLKCLRRLSVDSSGSLLHKLQVQSHDKLS